MATGGYPSRVPARHLIPPGAFDSSEDVGHFVDVSSASGVESFSSAGGVIIDDFDNDGRLEILTSNFDSCGAMQLFRRDADGPSWTRRRRRDSAHRSGGLNLVQADYDNDGCKDVLVMRGGWELAQRRSLLRNNCNGTFTDVTAAAGLLTPVTSSQTAVWADIDNDGWVDLFVGNEDAPSQLFRNQGNGTFVDIAAAAGVERTAFTKGGHSGRLRQRRLSRPVRLELPRREPALPEQRRPDIHRGGEGGRRAWCRPWIPRLVLRLRQRWLGGSVRQQLLPVARGDGPLLPEAAAERRDDEALSQRGRRHVPATSPQAGESGQGADADGLQLRRHRQRRIPRHLSRNRQPVLRLTRAQHAAAETRAGRRSST